MLHRFLDLWLRQTVGGTKAPRGFSRTGGFEQLHAGVTDRRFQGRFYGPQNFSCKTAQVCAPQCGNRIGELPSQDLERRAFTSGTSTSRF
jgi:hypothetical protein